MNEAFITEWSYNEDDYKYDEIDSLANDMYYLDNLDYVNL